jgi:hypothetical protein
MLRDFATSKKSILNHAGYLAIEGMPSLVGSLRPFQGLCEHDFLDLMTSLIGVQERISRPTRIERDIVCACWHIRSQMTVLALDELSPLRRHKLISQRDFERIHYWHRAIDTYCGQCFHGSSLQYCVSAFADYVGSEFCPFPATYRSLIPFFRDQMTGADDDIRCIFEQAIEAAGRK